MARRSILDPFGLNFLTLTVAGWVDVFSRQVYRDIIITNLEYCRKERGLMIIAYVIMTNHIHLVTCVKPENPDSLSKIIGEFKKYTAHIILKSIQSEPESRKNWLLHLFKYFLKFSSGDRSMQFWDTDNYPVALYTEKVLWSKIHYIHNNPVRAGFVLEAEHYRYSSASNYVDGKNIGLLEIDIMNPYTPDTGYIYIPQDVVP